MKRRLTKISIVVVIVLLVIIYYYPKPLNKSVIPNRKIIISRTFVNVVNGCCEQELSLYEFLPETDSYNRVINIFSKYTYHRNLRSLFKTNGLGSIKDLNYYIYFDIDKTNKIVELGGTGEIIIGNHSYNMEKSKQISLMNEIESLLSTETPLSQS